MEGKPGSPALMSSLPPSVVQIQSTRTQSPLAVRLAAAARPVPDSAAVAEADVSRCINAEKRCAPTSFVQPDNKIIEIDDMDQWKLSPAYIMTMKFILMSSQSVEGMSISKCPENSDAIVQFQALLSRILEIVETTECKPCTGRFGNEGFRDFFDTLQSVGGGYAIEASYLLNQFLGEELQEATCELQHYLIHSFGNSMDGLMVDILGQRIDYGSGHEFFFAALSECDSVDLVLSVFKDYLRIVRLIQLKFRLEPAGSYQCSHGVWGLDDFQFLPFLWGASQLKAQRMLKPKCIHDAEIVSHYSKDYLYLAAVAFINHAKTGPFAEHSPMLNDISGIKLGWPKVYTGLVKMYRAEVLGRYPVMQHFLFGNILPFQ